MDQYYLITFDNTSMTMMAETKLKEKNIKVSIMPTPTYITKSCGISIKIGEEEGEEVKGILEHNEVKFKAYFHKKGTSLEKLI